MAVRASARRRWPARRSSGAAFRSAVANVTCFLPRACESNHVKEPLTTPLMSATVSYLRGGFSS
jgi:hypothetical protein